MRDYIHSRWLFDLDKRLAEPGEKIPVIRSWACGVIDELVGEFNFLHFVLDDFQILMGYMRDTDVHQETWRVIMVNSILAAREHLIYAYGYQPNDIVSLSV